MDKKVALVTGASSGMGKETVLELLKKGFIVYGAARRVELLKDVEEKGAHALFLDLTDDDSMEKCVKTILQNEGQIDLLVNNAGYGSCGSIEEIPMEEIRRQFEVNLFSLGRMIQLVLPGMRKNRIGMIVNVSSMGGRFSSPFMGWYHATKYAVEAISDALRMETIPFNIKTVIIEPGMIQTNWGVIAAQNMRKYSGDGDYKVNADLCAKFYESKYNVPDGKLSSPSLIGKTIAKAAVSKNPKVRYLVGKNAAFYLFLKRIFSDKFYQYMTSFFLGLKRSL